MIDTPTENESMPERVLQQRPKKGSKLLLLQNKLKGLRKYTRHDRK